MTTLADILLREHRLNSTDPGAMSGFDLMEQELQMNRLKPFLGRTFNRFGEVFSEEQLLKPWTVPIPGTRDEGSVPNPLSLVAKPRKERFSFDAVNKPPPPPTGSTRSPEDLPGRDKALKARTKFNTKLEDGELVQRLLNQGITEEMIQADMGTARRLVETQGREFTKKEAKQWLAQVLAVKELAPNEAIREPLRGIFGDNI
jgi:hypothetical protein